MLAVAVVLLAGLCSDCVHNAAASGVQARQLQPRVASECELFSGRRLRQGRLHAHQPDGNNSAVLSNFGFPVANEGDQNKVVSGEDIQTLLEEEVTGTVHIEFAVGAIQLPGGELKDPNSAAIDCQGGFLDLRNVHVEGTIENAVCCSRFHNCFLAMYQLAYTTE